MLATPVTTLARDAEGDADVAEVVALRDRHDAVEVVVGLPRSLDGGEGPAAAKARRWARTLAAAMPDTPVRLVDERLSTVDAHRSLRESGVAGRRQRHVVDQVAAVVILQTALDLERSTGAPPGEPVGRRPRRPRTKGRA